LGALESVVCPCYGSIEIVVVIIIIIIIIIIIRHSEGEHGQDTVALGSLDGSFPSRRFGTDIITPNCEHVGVFGMVIPAEFSLHKRVFNVNVITNCCQSLTAPLVHAFIVPGRLLIIFIHHQLLEQVQFDGE